MVPATATDTVVSPASVESCAALKMDEGAGVGVGPGEGGGLLGGGTLVVEPLLSFPLQPIRVNISPRTTGSVLLMSARSLGFLDY